MLIIDGIAMSVNNGLAAAMTPNDYRISDVLKTRDLDPETDSDDNLIGIEDIYAEENEAEASLVDQFTDAVSSSLNVFKWVGEKVYYAMMRFMEEILFRISQAILVIINTLRVLFLTVLYICGPLVIAVSTIPGFESVAMRWLGRYLSVHLWLGIGAIFEAIAMRLWKIMVENGGFWTQGVGLEQAADAFILTSWAWMFLLVVIIGYVTIPIVAGWVISPHGMGQAGSLLAASVTKGAGGAIKEGVQAALYKPSK